MKFVLTLALLTLVTSCSYLPIPSGLNPNAVTVGDHQDYIELTPDSVAVDPVGLLFWPGGLVDPQAYRASLGEFAARGYRVVIAKVPLNLAIVNISKGWDLAQRLGGKWVAAGHSLGGTTAAWTVHDHPDAFVGLALMASYPSDGQSLASWTLPTLSIHGEFDGLATTAKINSKKDLLPAATVYVTIPGGNHGQFGDYGQQDGDGTATITPAQQWSALADELQSFWSSL